MKNRKNPLSKSTSSFVGTSSQMLKANALKAAQNLLNKGDLQNQQKALAAAQQVSVLGATGSQVQILTKQQMTYG
jgi:hypothetical protein